MSDTLLDIWDTSKNNGEECACDAGDPGWTQGQEDPLEEVMATLSSIVAWKIPWVEESGLL